MAMIDFTVYGQASPAGSKRHIGNGRIVDSNPRSREWKNLVRDQARAAMEEWGGTDVVLLDGPLSVTMTFYKPRAKAHYNAQGELRRTAPHWPTRRPDVLKLARGIEDACTGVIWRDDAQIVSETIAKTYGEPARCHIVIRPIE